MSDIKLTKDSDALICLMYKNYCEARKNGISKSKAKQLGSCETIHDCLTPNWSIEDTLETANELNRAGLINCLYADNTIYTSSISDEGISYMESRFKDNLLSIVEYLSKFKNLIPFI